MTDEDAWSEARWRPRPRPQGEPPLVHVRRHRDDAATTMSPEDVPRAAALGPQVLAHDERRALVRFWHHAPLATAVALSASGWWRLADPASCDLARRADGWWSGCFEVPADWQASYRLVEHTGDGPPPWWTKGLRDPGAHAVADPRAPERHRAARGQESAVVRMPAARRPWLARRDEWQAPRVLPAHSRAPRLWWWAAEAPGPLPLLVMTDGAAHVELGTHLALQRATELGALPPVAVVLVDAGNDRGAALGVPWGQASWIASTLIPRLRASGLAGREITSDPASTIVTGSSFGGLTALFAVARAPHTIGAAIAQSASFWRYRPRALVEPLVAAGARAPIRLRLQSGDVEGPPSADAAAIVEASLASGHDASSERRSGGHDWAWWQPAAIDAAIDLLS